MMEEKKITNAILQKSRYTANDNNDCNHGHL